MSRKVSLIFEEDQYKVMLNETELCCEKDMEKACEAFKGAVKNNVSQQDVSWQQIMNQIKELQLSAIEINEEYKNIALGNMKYFYHSDKVFYMGEGKMVALLGGFQFFYRVAELRHKGLIQNNETLVHLCSEVVEKNANYSLADECLMIITAAFSYGQAAYDFVRGKINKGTTSEKATFEAFCEYVEKVL